MGHSAQRVELRDGVSEQDRFDCPQQTVAALLEEVANLKLALEHSRDIGAAIGILMATRKVTREAAFDLLRQASQCSNVKLRVLALDVVEQGCIPE
jgi:AmiR/NasT family two-component response regulator